MYDNPEQERDWQAACLVRGQMSGNIDELRKALHAIERGRLVAAYDLIDQTIDRLQQVLDAARP